MHPYQLLELWDARAAVRAAFQRRLQMRQPLAFAACGVRQFGFDLSLADVEAGADLRAARAELR